MIDSSLNRLTISRHDFEQCLRFLDQIPNYEYGSTMYEALLISAIISYSRPFSRNEEKVNIKADSRIEGTVLDGLDDKEHELHTKLLNLRNKAIAHIEWANHPSGITQNGTIMSRPFSIWGSFQGANDILFFSELAKKVLLRAHHLTANKVLRKT